MLWSLPSICQVFPSTCTHFFHNLTRWPGQCVLTLWPWAWQDLWFWGRQETWAGVGRRGSVGSFLQVVVYMRCSRSCGLSLQLWSGLEIGGVSSLWWYFVLCMWFLWYLVLVVYSMVILVEGFLPLLEWLLWKLIHNTSQHFQDKW